jgi:hypothetical protein
VQHEIEHGDARALLLCGKVGADRCSARPNHVKTPLTEANEIGKGTSFFVL